MKKNILTKLLALVVAVVMMSGTCSFAFADQLEFSYDAYNKALSKTGKLLYDAMMKIITYEEGLELTSFFINEQYQAFLNLLGPEMEAELRALEAELYEVYKDHQILPEIVFAVFQEPVPSEYESDAPIVNFAQVAPFKAPVTGGQ